MTEELSLAGVVRSFEESSELLDQLRQRLVAMASSDQIRQESTSSLQGSANQLSEFCNELQGVVGQLVLAGGKLSDASALAEAQLLALSPDALMTALAEQRDGLHGVAARVDSIESATTGATEKLTTELTARVDSIESATTGATEKLTTELTARVDSIESATTGAIEKLTTELTASRSTIERQSAELSALQSKVAGLPDRVRRKHGLTEG